MSLHIYMYSKVVKVYHFIRHMEHFAIAGKCIVAIAMLVNVHTGEIHAILYHLWNKTLNHKCVVKNVYLLTISDVEPLQGPS